MSQSHVLAPWLLLQCGFSHDQPKTGVWVAKSGLKITAYGKHGAPFGKARIVWMYLATKAALSGPTVQVSLSEMANQFGGKARTIKTHIRRLAECYYQIPDPEQPRAWRKEQRRFFEIVNARGNLITVNLYEDFMASARDAAQIPLDLVAKFARANKLAPFDLCYWYHWQLHRGDTKAIAAFKPNGPYALLPIAENIDKRQADFRKHHETVEQFWPECPFHRNGTYIIYHGDAHATKPASKPKPTLRTRQKAAASSKPPANPRRTERYPPTARLGRISPLRATNDMDRAIAELRAEYEKMKRSTLGGRRDDDDKRPAPKKTRR